MRYLEAGDHHPDAGGPESGHLGLADHLRRRGEVRQQSLIGVEPVVDLAPRYDKGVPGSQRSDGEEDDAFAVLPEEPRGQLATDDPAEYGRHTSRLSRGPVRVAQVVARAKNSSGRSVPNDSR